ncbi:unnamed protein product [Candida verbasci]|uniref:WLM domain-containing protein n=1 Tax=Candida verbasci TaxID=1227364 RepID=A0A9W4TXV7_9ASCO|nr:unnamed protein product [Candida verbasci]
MVKKGRGSYPIKKPNKPSPVSNIGKIGSLLRYEDREYANNLLHEAAKLVAPIIHEHNFKVGVLCEMFPKNPNLLGLNMNKGQKILIRLRYASNERSFLPMSEIISTFLHELTHNLYGKHDKTFYDFLDKLKKRYEEIQYGGGSTGNYRCEENKLGSNSLSDLSVSIREKRIKELSKHKFKSEARTLASSLSSYKITKPKNPKLAALEAAERRLKDSRWCHSEHADQEEVPDDTYLEILETKDESKSESPEPEPENATPITNIRRIEDFRTLPLPELVRDQNSMSTTIPLSIRRDEEIQRMNLFPEPITIEQEILTPMMPISNTRREIATNIPIPKEPELIDLTDDSYIEPIRDNEIIVID